MPLRGDHVIGDKRQEHVDVHNLMEVFVRDFTDEDSGGGGGGGAADVPVIGGITSSLVGLLTVGDYWLDVAAGFSVYRVVTHPSRLPPTSDWTLIGALASGIVWASDVSYATDDMILTAGATYGLYRALHPSTGADPETSPTDWTPMARSSPVIPVDGLRTVALWRDNELLRTWPMTLAVACLAGVQDTFTMAFDMGGGSSEMMLSVRCSEGNAIRGNAVPGGVTLTVQRIADETGVIDLPANLTRRLALSIDTTQPGPIEFPDGHVLFVTAEFIDGQAADGLRGIPADAPNADKFKGVGIVGRGTYQITISFVWTQ